MSQDKTGRRRRSSSLIYTEPPETIEQLSDQSALPNLNAEWVNAKGASSHGIRLNLVAVVISGGCFGFQGKLSFADLLVRITNSSPLSIGAWTIHIVLIICLKIFYDIIPGVSQETSWTLTNISYMFGSYLMFHWVQGVPFDFNAGAYDNLNMWEQIDNGDQYTPAKKFLLSVPIVLFLLSTHYTHYDLTYFTINFLAVLGVVIPKLPSSHRMRVGFLSGDPADR
ncbi:MAG: ORM1-like protein 3 [Geoglossum simile]|nr:MAG: ORM1-like protein 3 [Geoglossum simile]